MMRSVRKRVCSGLRSLRKCSTSQAKQVHGKNDQHDQERGFENAVQSGELIGFHQRDPAGVGVTEFGVILDAPVQIGEVFLIHGNGVQGEKRRGGFAAGPAES